MLFHNRPVRAAMESAIEVYLVGIVVRPVEPNIVGNLFTDVTT